MNDSQSNYKSLHGRWELRINAWTRMKGWYLILWKLLCCSVIQVMCHYRDHNKCIPILCHWCFCHCGDKDILASRQRISTSARQRVSASARQHVSTSARQQQLMIILLPVTLMVQDRLVGWLSPPTLGKIKPSCLPWHMHKYDYPSLFKL